jgi:hypothetical protein
MIGIIAGKLQLATRGSNLIRLMLPVASAMTITQPWMRQVNHPGKLATLERVVKISVSLDEFGALNLKSPSVSFASKSMALSFISTSVRSVISLSNGTRGINPNSGGGPEFQTEDSANLHSPVTPG